MTRARVHLRTVYFFSLRYRYVIFLILLAVMVFFWTNWYFSPAKRLDRIAEDMLSSASQEVKSADISRMMSFLHVKVGGTMSVTSSCALPPCTVTVSHYYFTKGSQAVSEKAWRLEVTATLDPYINESGVLNLTPSKIIWKEKGWRWSVGIVDQENSAKNIFYSGTLAELSGAPKIDGTNTIASLLTAMATGMGKVLQQ